MLFVISFLCLLSVPAHATGDYCSDAYNALIMDEVPHKNPLNSVVADLDRRGGMPHLKIRDEKTNKELFYDPAKKWTAPLNRTAGFCWNPNNRYEIFTATMPSTGSPGIYSLNFKTRKSRRIADAMSKKGIFYLKNISKNGRYIIVDYDDDLAGGKEHLRRYIVDTKKGTVELFKKFKKKHRDIRFMQWDIGAEPRKHEC